MKRTSLVIAGLATVIALSSPAFAVDRHGTRDANGFPSNPTRPHVDRKDAKWNMPMPMPAAEPVTTLLAGAGLLGALALRRRRRP
jgi:MYXO-CTERM domain-containing protein